MPNISSFAIGAILALSATQSVDAFAGLNKKSHGLKPLQMAEYPTTAEEIKWTASIKSGERDELFEPIDKYCEDLYTVLRRKTRTVECGPIKFGSEHPIVRQTMATTNTADVDATVEQVMRCADKGFDLVRITVQGRREAVASAKIREALFKKGYDIPLCADMHFQPKVALMVADALEKIRINPGNFADGTKDFAEKIYESEADYVKEREYLAEAFIPLVEKCRDLNRAMRIGTNHGSLSSRVLSYYGDTPRGMVESALEFADICRSQAAGLCRQYGYRIFEEEKSVKVNGVDVDVKIFSRKPVKKKPTPKPKVISCRRGEVKIALIEPQMVEAYGGSGARDVVECVELCTREDGLKLIPRSQESSCLDLGFPTWTLQTEVRSPELRRAVTTNVFTPWAGGCPKLLSPFKPSNSCVKQIKLGWYINAFSFCNKAVGCGVDRRSYKKRLFRTKTHCERAMRRMC